MTSILFPPLRFAIISTHCFDEVKVEIYLINNYCSSVHVMGFKGIVLCGQTGTLVVYACTYTTVKNEGYFNYSVGCHSFITVDLTTDSLHLDANFAYKITGHHDNTLHFRFVG